jgi:ParB family chromosome partitioning protein
MTESLNVLNADINTLQPNPWNTNYVSPENEEKIKESLKRFGWVRPIIVRELEDEPGVLQILGGQHRWSVAKELGYTAVPVINLGRVDDKKAKEIGLVDNGRYGEDDVVALSELLKEIRDDNIELFLPYTDKDLENIFAASSYNLDDLDLDSDGEDLPSLSEIAGKPVQTHQIMRFKVPVEDAEMVQKKIEAVMKQQGFTGDDSMTNAGNALVHIMKAA